MFMVSACLAGINCRYDGENTRIKEIEQLVRNGKAIALCPELLGGLGIPRESCEIIETGNSSRRVVSKEGKDYTRAFEDGARKTLACLKTLGITVAILKSRSPSCGYKHVYDGTFTRTLKSGSGFTAELLEANGITVYPEEEFTPALSANR